MTERPPEICVLEQGATSANKELAAGLRADPDDLEDFDATPVATDRAWKARLIRMTRTRLGLSQTEFAHRFQVPRETLRDWEQAHSTPPDFATAYVKVIARHPELVAEEVA